MDVLVTLWVIVALAVVLIALAAFIKNPGGSLISARRGRERAGHDNDPHGEDGTAGADGAVQRCAADPPLVLGERHRDFAVASVPLLLAYFTDGRSGAFEGPVAAGDAGRLMCWVRLQSVAAGTVIPPAHPFGAGSARDRHTEEYYLWR